MPLTLLFFCFLSTVTVDAQKVDVATVVKNADYVFDGRIIDSKSYYSEEPYKWTHKIYTVKTIEIIHDYKGNINDTIISMVCEGGIIKQDIQYHPGPKCGQGRFKFLYVVQNNTHPITAEAKAFSKSNIIVSAYENVGTSGFKYNRISGSVSGFRAGRVTVLSLEKYPIGSEIRAKKERERRKQDFQGYFFDVKELHTWLKSQGFSVPRPEKKSVGLNEREKRNSSVIEIDTDLGALGGQVAGVGNIITIEGSGFGSTTGKVLFKDAQALEDGDLNFVEIATGLSDYTLGLDDIYIDNWEDDEIRVIIPSYIKDGYEGADFGIAGTGKIKVVTSSGEEKESDTELAVVAARSNLPIIDDVSGVLLEARPVYLAQLNGLDGFEFTLHSDFITFDDAAEAINAMEQAMIEWTDKTGVSLSFEKDNEGNYVYFNNIFENNSNVIRLGSSGSMATTREYLLDGNGKYYREGADITINGGVDSHYTVGDDLPINKLDFYRAFIHELGHVFNLNHTIEWTNLQPYTELMYPITHNFEEVISASNRMNLDNVLAAAAVATSNTMVTESQSILDWQCVNTLYAPSPMVFIDLYMKDCWNDIGNEPNNECNLDTWENIWESSDLWNRTEPDITSYAALDKSHQQPEQNEDGNILNALVVEVRNNSTICRSSAAKVHFYWTIASTGEIWDGDNELNNDWVNATYSDGGTSCLVGDKIGTVDVVRDDIPQGGSRIYGIRWTPPSQTVLEECGVPYDPDNPGQFEICLLARMEAAEDPLEGEQSGTGSTKNNVLNFNNVVTRNTFILPVTGGGIAPVNDPVRYIFIKNTDDFYNHLDISLDGIVSANSPDDCPENVNIDLVLTDELWNNWQSTGLKGDGVVVIAPKIVRIVDCSQAKLKDIPFDGSERQVLGLKASLVSGKNSPNFTTSYRLKITHESSDPSIVITPPTACIFDLDYGNFTDTGYGSQSEDILLVYPNIFSNLINITYALSELSNVSISLYNTQGKQIKNIMATTVQSSGQQSLYFDGSDLPKGIYLCTVSINGKTYTQKVIKL